MHLRLDYHQIFVELDLHFVLNEANLKTKIKLFDTIFKTLLLYANDNQLNYKWYKGLNMRTLTIFEQRHESESEICFTAIHLEFVHLLKLILLKPVSVNVYKVCLARLYSSSQ